jgi:hypothetical protein
MPEEHPKRDRFMTETERRQLARKPCDLMEVDSRGVAMSDERLGELLTRVRVLAFTGGVPGLDRAVAATRGTGATEVEMLAVHTDTGAVYAVNTEGSDYARYAGLIRPGLTR